MEKTFVTNPMVKLVGRPVLDLNGLRNFLDYHNLEWPEFYSKLEEGIDLGDRDAEWLVEMSGRNCYQSWPEKGGKQKGRSHEDHIKNLIQMKHFSTLEHVHFNFEIWNVSRSLTHELVRHRHANYSQISQRYVDSSQVSFIIPSGIQKLKNTDTEIYQEWKDHCLKSRDLYEKLTETLSRTYCDIDNKTERRKKARQAARSVLPNATETKVFMTMNARALRHFITMRANEAADLEIRSLAIEIYEIMKSEFSILMWGIDPINLPDGSRAVINKFTEV